MRTVVLVALATALSQQPAIQRGVSVPPKSPVVAGQKGSYYALIIGIDEYTNLPALRTAVSDAKSVDLILRTKYGFRTNLLLDKDATRLNILNALGRYRSDLGGDDNLVVYYGGHGEFDREADKAYWLPVDADRSSSANWIMADDITTAMKVLPARHVLVVSDSCYSGGIVRDANAQIRPQDHDAYLEKMLAGRSRTLIASGGIEPVADGGKNGHSVFANALLTGLQSPELAFTAEDLYHAFVKESVAGVSDQVPQYGIMRNSGHEAGDFVFLPTGSSLAPARQSALAAAQSPQLPSPPSNRNSERVVATPPASKPRVGRSVETFSAYATANDSKRVKIVVTGLPPAVDDQSVAFYLRQRLGASLKNSDEFEPNAILRLEASEQLDVPMPGCANEVVIDIQYHFEDVSGRRLPNEPAGSGRGHHCVDESLVQAEKAATDNAIAAIKNDIILGRQ